MDEVFWSCNKWTSGGLPLFYARTPARTPPGLCCLLCIAYVLGIQLTEDALRTVLNVGLHHSCRLHRGGCNPIPFGRVAVQPVKRRRHCSALWRSLLHSSPFCRVSPSFSLICSLPARLGWSAAHTPPGSSHRIVHPPTESQLSRHDTADLFTLFFSQMSLPGESTACTPVRWRARACSHQRRRRIYLRVRCPHSVRAISPPRTQTWTSPIVTEEGKGKHTGLQGWGSTAL